MRLRELLVQLQTLCNNGYSEVEVGVANPDSLEYDGNDNFNVPSEAIHVKDVSVIPKQDSNDPMVVIRLDHDRNNVDVVVPELPEDQDDGYGGYQD